MTALNNDQTQLQKNINWIKTIFYNTLIFMGEYLLGGILITTLIGYFGTLASSDILGKLVNTFANNIHPQSPVNVGDWVVVQIILIPITAVILINALYYLAKNKITFKYFFKS